MSHGRPTGRAGGAAPLTAREQVEALVDLLEPRQLEALAQGRDRASVIADLAARRERATAPSRPPSREEPPPHDPGTDLALPVSAEITSAREAAARSVRGLSRLMRLLERAFKISGWLFLGAGLLSIVVLFLTGQMDYSTSRRRWFIDTVEGVGGGLFALCLLGAVLATIVALVRDPVERAAERRQRRALIAWAVERGPDQLARGIPAPTPVSPLAFRRAGSGCLLLLAVAGGIFLAPVGAVAALAGLLEPDKTFALAMLGIAATGVLMLVGAKLLDPRPRHARQVRHDALVLGGVHAATWEDQPAAVWDIQGQMRQHRTLPG